MATPAVKATTVYNLNDKLTNKYTKCYHFFCAL